MASIALGCLLAATLVVAAAADAAEVDPCGADGNVITCENSKPGSPESEWDINGSGDPTIQGFSSDISVNAGSSIQFKIKTDAPAYAIDLYRIGYYQGSGARKIGLVQPSASLPQAQPSCAVEQTTNLVDCGNWAVSATWQVPADAVSGVYIAKLKRADTGGSSHIIFIVRNDSGHSPLVFQTADTTWQAYNNYGGYNFYTSASGRARKLSYNRPFNTRSNTPNGRDFFFASEYPMVRFLEGNGFDVSYIAGVDAARAGQLIKNHGTFVSVGHDEYWSTAQRKNVEDARDAGVNLAFFSGNEVYWKTRWEPSTAGTPTDYRTLVCYKETWDSSKSDPSVEWTGTWRDPRFSPPSDGGKPENSLTGTAYMVNDVDLPLKVPADDGRMRFWRNTSIDQLVAGTVATLAPSTLGYESDEDLDNGSRPAGLIRLSTTTASVPSRLTDYGKTTAPGSTSHSMTLYRATSGALVFGAGTIQWSWGLDDHHDGVSAPLAGVPDVRMQQATLNLLADMGAQPVTLLPGLSVATKSTDTAPPTTTITAPQQGSTLNNGASVSVNGTATDAGGGVVGGVEVSLDGGATWHLASGRESWSYSGLAAGVGTQQIMARATDDSGNIESQPSSRAVTVACPCSLFASDSVPSTAASSDTAAIEVGVKFKSDVAGWITGVRFYKGIGNTGTHIGSLWNTAGVRLATGQFTNETNSGWQQLTFDTAVPISAGTTYVASYFAPNGHYSVDRYGFSEPRGRAPLHTQRDGVPSANGVYKYGTASAFPTSGYQGTNFWVDAVFTNQGSADTTPPAVLALSPVDGQWLVDPSSKLKVAFSEPVNQASIVWNVSGGAGTVAGVATYDADTMVATFTPSAPLSTKTQYSVTLSGATDAVGNVMPTKTWNFGTWSGPLAAGECPCSVLSDATPAVPSVSDTAEAELGMKFRASVTGVVTGVKFYKGAGNVGPHTVTLWSGTGAELAKEDAYFETASGWQSVLFKQAVPISANTTYVVSYHAFAGRYGATANQFASAVTSGPLKGLAKGTDGGNGVYKYGTRAFPTQTFGSTGYGVDVIFRQPLDDIAPELAQVQPGAGATSVPVATLPRVVFNEPVATGTAQLTLTGPGGTVAGSTSLSADGTTLTFTPAAPLTAATAYELRVSGAEDRSGNVMTSVFSASFTTSGVAVCPCTVFASDALPVTRETTDATALELGLKFVPSVDGYVRGVRFYKGSGNTGTHVGRLWSSSGTLLQSATFAGETTSGWQNVTFASPVPVTHGLAYVVSYSAPAGHYAANSGFFTAGQFVNYPLLAQATNGLYATTVGAFPTKTFGGTNYWVDLSFTPLP
jgi:hypothetical protein